MSEGLAVVAALFLPLLVASAIPAAAVAGIASLFAGWSWTVFGAAWAVSLLGLAILLGGEK